MSDITAAYSFIPGSIVDHPTSVTVSDGEYAQFSCSINCTDHVALRWRLAAPGLNIVNDRYIKTRPLKKLWRKKGITIDSETTISESTDCEVVMIKILATSDMNGAVVQCAAIGTRQNVSSSYSRYAVLQVEQVASGDQIKP